ncbi:SRPBCC domain-containing protein [Dyadobacter subterraneus]|uniref:SRPBCC domain-containing protein n=1 Tax=Dyadobacter subterraneus TaxID=2773304 RepID=A0ABR9WDP2_9BACT|nr:SRPBCC family protein [Dyadobacter subterraneus]MBE9463533.1 SRPBCC domain-containing protein [Dyadobacter subterraneus]
MAKNLSTIFLNASVSKVWDALTKPELVKLWQYGSELVTTWEVGSTIRFSVAWDGKLFEQWGVILEIRPKELIKYSLFAPRPGLEDKPENYFIMHYILTDENGQVKLEILQEDNRPGAVQEAPQGEENPVLKMLKDIVESAG